METVKCTTCNTEITSVKSNTEFKCPKCGKAKIVRCGHCRSICAEYKCPECTHVGP